MEVRDILQFTGQSLAAHRSRSMLTALGIAIGVTAVVLLTSMGEGLNRYILTQFSQFGTDVVIINPGKPSTLGFSPGVINTVKPLTIADGQALSRLPSVEAWVPGMSGTSEVEGNGRVRSTTVLGSGAMLPTMFEFRAAIGTFLPDDNPESPRALAVLGATLKRDLFDEANPLGKRIRIGGNRYRVVGVMESKGTMLGFDMDDMIIIPAARAMNLYNKSALQEIDLKYLPGTSVPEFIEDVKRLLISRHGHEDFSIVSQQQMLDVLGSVLGVVTFAVGALGGISLLVGGVGIFTIMTIAVRERTREIGLLRSLGSSRRQVQSLFLSESVVLAALGGALGLALGIGLVTLLRLTSSAIPVSISLPYLIAAEGVAIVTGLVAGVLPAHRAAGMNPLDALRTE